MIIIIIISLLNRWWRSLTDLRNSVPFQSPRHGASLAHVLLLLVGHGTLSNQAEMKSLFLWSLESNLPAALSTDR